MNAGTAAILCLAVLAYKEPLSPTTSAEIAAAAANPRAALRRLEEHLKKAPPALRPALLKEAAPAAFDAGDMEGATRYAKELLAASAAQPRGWDTGNGHHLAHAVLGRVALRARDTPSARKHLLESARTPGSPQLNSFGPNMLLAREMLERGERKVVIDHFVACATFWKSGRERGVLTDWAKQAQAGQIPDFGANLKYGWYDPQRGTALDRHAPPVIGPLSGEERQVYDTVVAEARSEKRAEFERLLAEVSGGPAKDASPAGLEKTLLVTLPAQEVAAAAKEPPVRDAQNRTPAQRFVDIHHRMRSVVLRKLEQRIPDARLHAFLQVYKVEVFPAGMIPARTP
jgi:hypothetical protein